MNAAFVQALVPLLVTAGTVLGAWQLFRRLAGS